MPFSSLAQAIGSFLNVYKPNATGVTQEGPITYQFERYNFWDDNFRVHVIVENKLEDLDVALQKAIDSENFELASRLRDVIAARDNAGNKTEDGENPI